MFADTEYRLEHQAKQRRRNDGDREKNRERYRRDPEFRARQLARQAEKRASDPEGHRVYTRNWRHKNPDKMRVYWARAAARRSEREGEDILRDDPCAYCGGPAGTIDHIVAFSLGGQDAWENYTAACQSCNSRKGTRSLLDFFLTPTNDPL